VLYRMSEFIHKINWLLSEILRCLRRVYLLLGSLLSLDYALAFLFVVLGETVSLAYW